MPDSRHSQCVARALAMGLSPQDAQDLVDFIAAERGANAPALAAAHVQEAVARELRRAAAKRRRAKIDAVKGAEFQKRVDAMVAESGGKMHEIDAVEAILAGTERNVTGGRASVAANAMAIRTQLTSEMVRGLQELGVLRLVRSSEEFSENVIREMREPGKTGDPLARATAEHLSRLFERTRQLLNAEGADIGKLDNYCPQAHDAGRMMKAGEAQWTKDIERLVDFEKTMPDASPDEVRDALHNIYYNIITDTPSRKKPSKEVRAAVRAAQGGQGRSGSGRPGAGGGGAFSRNTAAGFEHERVIHFRDAEAAVEYNQLYGRGTVFLSAWQRLERTAQKAALMRELGTDPAAAVQAALQKAAKKAKAEGRDGSPFLKAWDRDGTGRTAILYKAVAGETGGPQNLTLARIGAGLRAVTSLTKLGAAVLSGFSDVGIKGMAAHHAGADLLRCVKASLDFRIGRLQKAERLRLGRQLGVFINGYMGDLCKVFDAQDSFSGAASDCLEKFFRITGLTGWSEAHRAGYAHFISNELAEAAVNGPNKDFAAVLNKHGLADKLGLARHLVEEVDGVRYAVPENVSRIPEAEIVPLLPQGFRKTAAQMDAAGAFQAEAARQAQANARRPANRRRQSTPTADELRAAYEKMREAELVRAREKLHTDFMAFLSDETGYAVMEPDARTSATMKQGTRPGTAVGEMVRLMGQFKSFPVTYWRHFVSQSHWQRASAQPVGGYSALDLRGRLGNDIPGLVAYFIASMGLGYLSGAAKDLSKGRSLRDPSKPSTIMAALLQSGGLGLAGDFFLGTEDRFGNQASGFLTGPFFSDFLAHVPAITGMAARGEFADSAETLARYALGNLPAASIPLAMAAARRAGPAGAVLSGLSTAAMSVNAWYSRAAFDYLVGFHIREALSPGTLRKQARRMRRESNQTFIVDPTRVIKRGGGFR